MVVNLLFGLPKNKLDYKACFSAFFSLNGTHIVCGGTTAQQVAGYLQKDLVLNLHYEKPQIPPISYIENVDLVTEGIVTMTYVLRLFTTENCEDDAKDGASLIYKFLRQAQKINFFVGSTENPANSQFPQLKSKVQIVRSLAVILRNLGKKIEVRVF